MSPHGGTDCPLMPCPLSALRVPSSRRQPPPPAPARAPLRCDRPWSLPPLPAQGLPMLDPSAAAAVARARSPAWPPDRRRRARPARRPRTVGDVAAHLVAQRVARPWPGRGPQLPPPARPSRARTTAGRRPRRPGPPCAPTRPQPPGAPPAPQEATAPQSLSAAPSGPPQRARRRLQPLGALLGFITRL